MTKCHSVHRVHFEFSLCECHTVQSVHLVFSLCKRHTVHTVQTETETSQKRHTQRSCLKSSRYMSKNCRHINSRQHMYSTATVQDICKIVHFNTGIECRSHIYSTTTVPDIYSPHSTRSGRQSGRLRPSYRPDRRHHNQRSAEDVTPTVISSKIVPGHHTDGDIPKVGRIRHTDSKDSSKVGRGRHTDSNISNKISQGHHTDGDISSKVSRGHHTNGDISSRVVWGRHTDGDVSWSFLYLVCILSTGKAGEYTIRVRDIYIVHEAPGRAKQHWASTGPGSNRLHTWHPVMIRNTERTVG